MYITRYTDIGADVDVDIKYQYGCQHGGTSKRRETHVVRLTVVPLEESYAETCAVSVCLFSFPRRRKGRGCQCRVETYGCPKKTDT